MDDRKARLRALLASVAGSNDNGPADDEARQRLIVEARIGGLLISEGDDVAEEFRRQVEFRFGKGELSALPITELAELVQMIGTMMKRARLLARVKERKS